MANNKLKVAIICSFSNAKVRAHLPLDSRRLYVFARKLMRLPAKSGGYVDLAAWDTYMIEHLQKRDDIELHVISAHSGLKKNVCRFDLEGVHYYFVSCDMATMLKHIIPSPALWHRLNPMRPKVRRIVKSINPDILALVGAENPHISGTVLGLKDYPLIVKCQTIYNNPDRKKYDEWDEKNAYVERRILESIDYVSVAAKMHYDLFRQMNPRAVNFAWRFGNLFPDVEPAENEFDFVNFAMYMSDKKGFPDAVKALAIVKKKYPEVKMNLVGGGTDDEKQVVTDLIEQYGLKDNVTLTPSFEKQEDVFQHLQKSRFAVLPCKIDSVASTIRQSMYYGLPVVCYKTVGTPKLNTTAECVLIAENGNVEDLATKMLFLLDNPVKAEELRKNAKQYIESTRDDAAIAQQIVDNFRAIVDNYRNGTPIPEELIAKVK